MELQNYSRHSDVDLEQIRDEVTSHSDLVAALAFARRVRGVAVIPRVVTQDEYTHDVTLPIGDELYLAYGMT